MESDSSKLVTYNIKKTQRFENKKRKLEALLDLFEEENKSLPSPKKKAGDSLNNDYKSLKDQLKAYVKKPEPEPSFCLKNCGTKARINFRGKIRPDQNIEPLFIENIYQLLMRSAIGHFSPYPCNWAKLENPQKLSKTVLLVVEGLPKSYLAENISKLTNITDIFPCMLEIVSSNIPFATELSTLHMVTDYHIQAKNSYSSMFPEDRDVKIDSPENDKLPSKLHLLLSPIQMVMENYPVPSTVFQHSKSDGYVFTQMSYAPVTKDSPLFALDCEMCRSEHTNELTRIAVVDENLDTVYHTLVKPELKIIDYMTKYSGITRQMLANVTTKLSDVQQDLQLLLPPDAILCGQSLNCDLHALKMIHPYVVDTSIIFNNSGMRAKKTSLKSLTKYFLGEVIQDNKWGHNPIEDAIATMKLVQLKLQNGIQFGDACLQNNSETDGNIDTSSCSQASSTNTENSACDNSDTSSITVPHNEKDTQGFFANLSRFSKKVCLIGDETSLSHYDSSMLDDRIERIIKPNRKKIVKSTLKQLEANDLIVSHVSFDLNLEPDSLLELDNIVKQTYLACADKTIYMILLSGVDGKNYSDIKSGLFMVVIKKRRRT